MLEQVKERLRSLGITVSSEPASPDGYLVTLAVEKTVNYINSQTNLSAVPSELIPSAIDMAAGEFLFTKKSMGLLDVNSLDFTAVTRRVKDGDTDVEFAVDAKTTPEAKFEAFLKHLQQPKVSYAKYRVLTW